MHEALAKMEMDRRSSYDLARAARHYERSMKADTRVKMVGAFNSHIDELKRTSAITRIVLTSNGELINNWMKKGNVRDEVYQTHKFLKDKFRDILKARKHAWAMKSPGARASYDQARPYYVHIYFSS
jgi:hypothetical protein